jgi:hypothetical protein
VSGDCNDSESISECLNRVGNEKSCDLYGKKNAANSWPSKILEGIKGIQDEYEAKKSIEIYSGLNLTRQFEEPMRFKRVIAYLCYVTFIFYIVVAIYQIKVAPAFLEAFENFELSIPSHLLFYQDYWGYLVLLISILLITALLMGFQIKRLFSFDTGIENSLIIKYLVFRNIRKSYLRIIDILEFPILCAQKLKTQNNNPITSHLQAIKNSKMSVSTEMQALIEIEMKLLLENCEKQLKFASVAVALVVVSAIFFFLVSAYSPIFILGDAV